MYTNKIQLTNGDVVKVVTSELPTLSEQNLLHFQRSDGSNVTFVLENVAYFSTRGGV